MGALLHLLLRRRRQVRGVRFVRAPGDAGAHLRRVQLRLVRRALRHLRRRGHLGRVLLQGVHGPRKGREAACSLLLRSCGTPSRATGRIAMASKAAPRAFCVLVPCY